MLFTPMQIGNLKLANRIVIAPMGQYSAEDGQVHLRRFQSDPAISSPWREQSSRQRRCLSLLSV